VLQQQDPVRNAEDNYRQLMDSTRRARRLADAGRLPQIQVDQAIQDELRARNRWIIAEQQYGQRQDSFKITLGLPTDSDIQLDHEELARLTTIIQENDSESTTASAGATMPADEAIAQDTAPVDQTLTAPAGEPATMASTAPAELVPPVFGEGPLEIATQDAICLALAHRVDLKVAQGRVYDAQRQVVVAADALRAGLTLTGTGRAGGGRSIPSAALPDVELRPERGVYDLALDLDLPLERTAERNAYRNSYIELERSTRSVQELEDQIKLQIRDALRGLLAARESYRIQRQAVTVAERRVESTHLFLEAGRAEIRDVLEAQESLVSAQDALTAALVTYRVAELALQRDMGVLEVDEKGNWHEYNPELTEE
jgi:outer membrane protein TolC